MTNHTELTHFIRKTNKIDDDELKIVLSSFKIIKKRKNDILFSNKKNSQVRYFVKKGCLSLFYIDEEGKDVMRYIAF